MDSEYRFSSLMKQKKRGGNYAVFCFAGKRFFFILHEKSKKALNTTTVETHTHANTVAEHRQGHRHINITAADEVKDTHFCGGEKNQ